MVLSEELGKVRDQSRRLEASIEATTARNDSELSARKVDLENELASGRARIRMRAAITGDAEAADWADAKKLVSDAFASLREDSATRRARWSAKRAGRAAEDAAVNPFESIDFALYSIQEAEYAVIEAAMARGEADRKALEAAADAPLSGT